MAVASRSHPDLNMADAIGTYGFSCAPPSLFLADGQLLVTNDKATIMHKLESLPADIL